jgi:hypothetical protein
MPLPYVADTLSQTTSIFDTEQSHDKFFARVAAILIRPKMIFILGIKTFHQARDTSSPKSKPERPIIGSVPICLPFNLTRPRAP